MNVVNLPAPFEWGEPIRVLAEAPNPLLTPAAAALALNCTVSELKVRWERGEVDEFRIGSLRRYRIIEHLERREYMRGYQREWMARRRAEWLTGKCCVDCGSTENLELHHRDPGQKTTHRIWSWSEERRLAETAKCDLLCNACHNGRHGKVAAHGGERRYRRGCRCDACLDGHERHKAKRRARQAAKRTRRFATPNEGGDLMPMVITAAIYEGNDVSLRDYLMRVGRSMSMAIMQRDSDQDEPVKPRQESDYARRRVEEHRAELERLGALSVEDAAGAAEREFVEATEFYEKAKAEKAALRRRYEDMLAQVEAWEPDSKVIYVKEHAIKYLRESIEFDCSKDGDDMRYYPKPERLSGVDWLAQKIADAQRSLEYAEKQLAEEVARVADFNEHIEAFLRSLPPEREPVGASR